MVEENGRITWYEAIKESLSDIRDDIREIKNTQKEQSEKLNDLCVSIGQHETAIKTNSDEIKTLRSSSRILDGVISAITIIFGLSKS